jgi:hypothetical protein
MKRIGALALCAGALLLLAPAAALAGKDGAWHTASGWESEWGSTEYQVNGVKFTSSPGTDVFLENPEAEPAIIDHGEWVLKNATLGGQVCSSFASLPGEVHTETLIGKLGIVNAKTDEVGLETKAEATKTFAKYTCGETFVEMRGAVIGQITPVKTPLAVGEPFTVSYASKAGKQAIAKFQGGHAASLEVSLNKGKFKKVAFTGTDLMFANKTQEVEILETKKGK